MMKILLIGLFCVSLVRADPLSIDFESCLNDKIVAQNRITENLYFGKYIEDGTEKYNVTQWIDFNGYDSEEHQVITEDGYVLSVHRLRKIQTGKKNHNTPVFLQHGLLSSSMDWILAGPNKSLGFLLADQGFDVWLGNTRGNKYSRGHKHFNTDSEKYWNFSWHEMGVYDLPAMIDFVLEKTSHEKLFYVGHSQGTTSFFVMTSVRPSYNEKIIHMFALAPVVFCDHMPNILFRNLANLDKNNYVDRIRKLLGINEFKATDSFITDIVSKLCTMDVYGDLMEKVCSNVMFSIVGFNQQQFDKRLLGRIIHNFPAGASIKQFLHYAKLINTGGFHSYDTEDNYNLTKVTARVTLFSSENDLLSSNKDVQRLGNKLPNTLNNHLVEDKSFNHCDYLWSKNAVDMVYSKVLKLMSEHLPQTTNSNFMDSVKNFVFNVFHL